ncbi:MAG: hypothetical protein KIT22_07205 [Verrucomicrobiae bacterium]|nr:hypothetical protein [Verrucomicrobiae bacterium]
MSAAQVHADDAPDRGLRSRLVAALGAWQPFSGRGLAQFAEASALRLMLFQAIFAAVFAFTLAWSYGRIVTPAVQAALQSLPPSDAGIRSGVLRWPEPGPRLLAASPQLAWVCDPAASGELGLNADLQLDLRRDEIAVRGLLGSLSIPYPPNLDLPLDRTGAPAVWGAWRIPLWAAIAGAAGLAMPAIWWLLATVYWLPAWGLGSLFARDLTASGALRIAAAALLPASLIPCLALAAYATLWVRAPGFVLLWMLHLPAGWLWLAWGILCRPPQSRRTPGAQAPESNPFSKETGGTGKKRSRRPAKNPFDA